MPRARSDEALQVADKLHSAAIRLLRRLRLLDAASGVGPAQLSALSVLVFGGKALSLRELADAEQVKPPTMSRIVAGMIRAGLAKIAISCEDRRCLVISPTKKGNQVLQRGRRRRIGALAKALREFPPDQLQQLGEAIYWISAATKKL